MRVARVDANTLADWLVDAAGSEPTERPLRVEFHVLAQGYELRCNGHALELTIDREPRRGMT